MKQGRPASHLGHSLPAASMRALFYSMPLWLIACATPDDASKDSTTAATAVSGSADDNAPMVPDPEPDPGPSAYDPDLPDATAAVYSELAVEDALALSIDGLSRLSSDPVFDAYDTAMSKGEDYCPLYYEQNGNTFWYGSCTTSGGTWFDGYGFYTYYEDYLVDANGNVWDTEYISGAATVREAAGETFHVGGYVQKAWTVGANGFVIEQDNLLGSFLDDDAEAGTWLADGLQPSIYTYASYAETGGFSVGGYRGYQGSLGGMGEGGQVALDTDYLIVATTSLGTPCADEPAGTVTVRTADGGWWSVTFDMQPETFEMTGACDGCGTVTDASGAVVGTACADFSALLSN